ncbi:aminoacyl-tRNA hydrolase [Accumulibacter sp.]|uniref:aminoacyl-tRNA hydrolase n=1 Tax=Accumulibacter sp. TaxID=2053492 RepID=UPI0025E1242C|nr:aminoacyl-tRNA hydrolase [Accumulibacter sp.]MCM8595007.1 aminoacyl-tRNA hydrolase [Accumulibacter sp.]MCM8625390.1 aminoacyl-tRNA hydrolase [Accumulibacter sp.]MDS4049153.1 aminoacyl-tRNA hydrolase [Accumulibacter sp.]
MPAPRLIVGLGNPGRDYEDHRHNVGYWFVDQLAQQLRVTLTAQGKFFGRLARAGDLWLLQPTTYMNLSGQAVAALARFYRIGPDETLVVHDDLDLPPGGIRLKQGGGNGGHNGLRDIQARLATPDFWRLRLGIGHPGDREAVIRHVLQAPRRDERELIERALDRCLLAWPALAAGDYAAAQRQLHVKIVPS